MRSSAGRQPRGAEIGRRRARYGSAMELRAAILERLATPRMETRFGTPYFPQGTMQALGCRPPEFWEAVWGLLSDGLVYIDPAGQAQAQTCDNWHWHLSARGIQAATGGSWEPRDPEGYLSRLRRRAPDLDEGGEADALGRAPMDPSAHRGRARRRLGARSRADRRGS